MTKNVKKIDNAIKTWVGGTSVAPMARRTNPSTMAMRTKHVTIIRMDGAKLNIVNIKTNCMLLEMVCGCVRLNPPMVMETGEVGATGAVGTAGPCGGPIWARAGLAAMSKHSKMPNKMAGRRRNEAAKARMSRNFPGQAWNSGACQHNDGVPPA